MNMLFKVGVFILLGLAMLVTVGVAETKYISEEFEITLRTGPGNDRKIIALVPSGRQVTILNAGEEWSEVSLPNGKQGWVLTRYLTNKEPTALVLERLQKKHEKVLAQNDVLQQRLNELSADNKQLADDFSATQDAFKNLTMTHEGLKKESADFLKLKAKYESTLKEMTDARAKAEKYENELHKLTNNEFNTGLLYGGGLLIAGFVVGYILKRPKRKSPLL